MKFTIGKKIGFGFGSILLVFGATSYYAIQTMHTAVGEAHHLAEDYVPELAIADRLQGGMATVMLNGRSFGFTGDKAFLEKAHTAIGDLHAAITDAQGLSTRAPRLTALAEHIKVLPELVTGYEKALGDTVTLADEDAANQVIAFRNGTQANGAISDLMQKELEKLVHDSESEAQRNAMKSLEVLQHLSDLVYKTRLSNFRSQTLRDPKILEEGLKAFEGVEKDIAELNALDRTGQNRAVYAELSKELKGFGDAARAKFASLERSVEIRNIRDKAAAGVETSAEALATGAQHGTQRIAQESVTTLSRSSQLNLFGALAAFAAGIGVAFFITRGITGPLQRALGLVRRVAERDLTQRVENDSADEIGEMCRSLNDMVGNLAGNVHTIGASSTSVAAASEELSSVSTQVSTMAEKASQQANSVAAAAEQMSTNMTTVATAAEELGSTIKDIAKNASDAARIATQGVQTAQHTNASVAKLGESSEQIGNVVKTITSIAEQTNLLALNATIEAARAGEAGKGFAVVANEVKELAKQTAVATEDISAKITTIQNDAQAAVSAIREISEIIEKINELQTTIASAVEEQSAVTSEIARNASEAAHASGDITRSIGEVSDASRSTTDGAQHTNTAAEELARLAADLQSVVEQFRVNDLQATTPTASGAARKSNGTNGTNGYHGTNGSHTNGKHGAGYLNGKHARPAGELVGV